MGETLLINQLLSGNRTTINAFVVENKDRVFRTCLAYVQNKQDAEDLTQNVFVKVFDKLHQHKGEAKISTWLIRIAINLSLNYLRDNKKRLQHLDVDSIEIKEEETSPVASKEVKLAVRYAIYRLPEKQRKVFILSFYLNMSYQEIKEVTGFSISSIESLLFRARKRLKSMLTDFYSEFIHSNASF